MSVRFVEDYRDVYPVRVLCVVLEVAPSERSVGGQS